MLIMTKQKHDYNEWSGRDKNYFSFYCLDIFFSSVINVSLQRNNRLISEKKVMLNF